jgi:hypothetical protein
VSGRTPEVGEVVTVTSLDADRSHVGYTGVEVEVESDGVRYVFSRRRAPRGLRDVLWPGGYGPARVAKYDLALTLEGEVTSRQTWSVERIARCRLTGAVYGGRYWSENDREVRK